jgi:hypothetical protein
MVYFDQPGINFDEGHFFDEPDPPAPTTGIKMPLFRIGLNFMRMGDSKLDDFATNVVVKVTANPTIFPGQTALVTSVGTAQVAFHNSLSAAINAGKAATADKEAKRAILLGVLRQLAFAIQGILNLTAANAELSGYDVVIAGPHGPVSVDVPVILDITNPASTKLGVKLQGVTGAKAYEFRARVNGTAPARLGTFPSTRGIVLEDLTPATLYMLESRAVFGSNRFSEWSEPVQHMCT